MAATDSPLTVPVLGGCSIAQGRKMLTGYEPGPAMRKPECMKLLATLVVSIALNGSAVARSPSWVYTFKP